MNMKLSVAPTPRENLLGFGYLLISLFFLPSLLFFVSDLWRLSLSLINIIFCVLGFLCVVGIFHEFLWASWKKAWERPWKTLWCAVKGLVVYFGLSFVVSVFVSPFLGPHFSTPNDTAIVEVARENPAVFIFCTVFLAPVTEEVLYRGLLFQGFCRRWPKLSLCLSVLIFAAIHVLDYIGSERLLTLVCCFVLYLPAGLSFINAYIASDTIVTPILMHIVINLLAAITQMR